MHSAVVAGRDQVAVRGEGGPPDNLAGQDGRRRAEHRDPALAVADRDDREAAAENGECGVGGGGGVDGGDHGPSRVFAEHDQASGHGLAERRERLAAACYRNGSGWMVGLRRCGELPACVAETPVQQSSPGSGEEVHFAAGGREHRHGVVDAGPAEVHPARLVGEPRTHPAAGVADRDHCSPARCHGRRRWSDVCGRLLGRRRGAECLPVVVLSLQENPARVPVLHDERVRVREPGRTALRHEPRRVHNGLARPRALDQLSAPDVGEPDLAVSTGRCPVRAPGPAMSHAVQPRRVGLAQAHLGVVRRVTLEDRAFVGDDVRGQVRRRVGGVVVAIVDQVRRGGRAQRQLGESRGHHMVRVVVVVSPLRLVPAVRFGVVGPHNPGLELPVKPGQRGDDRRSVMPAGTSQCRPVRLQRLGLCRRVVP
ncbi:hypothetical protein BJ970_004248 [Saccharopolyspora phatthalungensis]|uniref:Uncharacterized protein n=1 Tax=Saccharopolyspora phatthalungensis TaxID=664693 RepID=A0A840Q7N7_9PSEU|nr:hypothetical protein [Saccharopolyspora phatthalungensis]MBB5156714.1 hypothetical protein [Saccharopolyspora phatthalungensis]